MCRPRLGRLSNDDTNSPIAIGSWPATAISGAVVLVQPDEGFSSESRHDHPNPRHVPGPAGSATSPARGLSGGETMKTRPGRPRGLTRLARALGLDRNPLRRATDRAEAWIRVGLLAVFLIAGPMAALVAA